MLPVRKLSNQTVYDLRTYLRLPCRMLDARSDDRNIHRWLMLLVASGGIAHTHHTRTYIHERQQSYGDMTR